MIVACWGAVLFAVVGAFLAPLRIGSVLVPVSLLLAVAGPALAIRFAAAATGKRALSLIPGGVWLVVTAIFSTRNTEGDLVLTELDWVAIAYPLVGGATLAYFGYLVARDFLRNSGGIGG
jgi:hypothetical protein